MDEEGVTVQALTGGKEEAQPTLAHTGGTGDRAVAADGSLAVPQNHGHGHHATQTVDSQVYSQDTCQRMPT